MAEWTTEDVRRAVLGDFATDWVKERRERLWADWLTAHDAEVRAKALEDAADVALLDRIGGFRWIADAVAVWLRVRARAERGQ